MPPIGDRIEHLLAKYLAFKTRKGRNPKATMRLWREDAEQAYWEADDPHFLSSIPPEILRSYIPGTESAYPWLPDLALVHGSIEVQDAFDVSEPARRKALRRMPHEDLDIPIPRGKHTIKRLENVVENALRRDGTALQHLLRPYTEWSCIAVTATPLAVTYVPARGRGVAVSDEGVAPTHAMHVAVQRAAFAAHPVALMMFPAKFDELLVRQLVAPQVLDFAKELTRLYGRWVQMGKSFNLAHHTDIDQALRHCAEGHPNERIDLSDRVVPLLDLMRADADAAHLVEPALLLHTNDQVMAAREVLNAMGQGGSETFELPQEI